MIFLLTVFKECFAQNDNVQDEPRRKIIQVGTLSDYCLTCRRMKLTGFMTVSLLINNHAQIKTNHQRERRARGSRKRLLERPTKIVFRPLTNRSLLPIVDYQ